MMRFIAPYAGSPSPNPGPRPDPRPWPSQDSTFFRWVMPLFTWAVIVISIMLMSNIVLTMTEIKMQPAGSPAESLSLADASPR